MQFISHIETALEKKTYNEAKYAVQVFKLVSV